MSTKSDIIEGLKLGHSVTLSIDADDNSVDAEWLGNLIAGYGELTRTDFHVKGLTIENFRLVGSLDWSDFLIPKITFLNCIFDYGIIAKRIKVDGFLVLEKCSSPFIDLTDAVVNGDLVITDSQIGELNQFVEVSPYKSLSLNSISITGFVNLQKSIVKGFTDLSSSKMKGLSASDLVLVNPGANTLDLWNSVIEQDVYLKKINSNGQINGNNMQIGGSLKLSESTLTSTNGEKNNAFLGSRMRIGSNFNFDHTKVTGSVDFSGSDIGGQVDFNRSEFDNESGFSILAHGCNILNSVRLSDGFISNGAITFRDSKIGGSLNLTGARLSISLDDKQQSCFDGSGIEIQSSLWLSNSTVNGSINLISAKIHNDLYLNNASISAQGYAIKAWNLIVDNSVFLIETFTSNGSINFKDAKFGVLNARNSSLNNYGGFALDCSRLSTQSGVWMTGAECHGVVSFQGAIIRDDFDLSNSKFINPGKFTLLCNGIEIHAQCILTSIVSEGEINFRASHITGSINLNSSILSNPHGYSFSAWSSLIQGDFFLRNNFKSLGVFDFNKSKMGTLAFEGASFFNNSLIGPTGSSPISLRASNIHVQGNAQLEQVSSSGSLCFDSAIIDGHFSLIGGKLDIKDKFKSDKKEIKWSFLGELLQVRGNLLFRGNFESGNDVRLINAVIGGVVGLNGASFYGGKEAFFANQLNARRLDCHETTWGDSSKISLRLARVTELRDAPNAWPSIIGNIDITGFSYDQFEDLHNVYPPIPHEEWSVESRLDWIRIQTAQSLSDVETEGEYSPQPYTQLAKVYLEVGKDHERRVVLMNQQSDLLKYGELSKISKIWSRLLRFFTGYGFQLWKTLIAIIVVYLMSVALITGVKSHDGLLASDSAAEVIASSHNLTSLNGNECNAYYPCASDWIYPLDSLVPVINFHQADFWSFNASNGWGNYGQIAFDMLTLSGWALASLLVAGASGLINKDN